jgi:hypothetical protein
MSGCDSPAPFEPGDEHGMLQRHLGTWNVDCTYFMDPSQPPMKVQAKETVEGVGPFWTVSRFESDMMGMAFVGRATLGYDSVKKKWVGTWIDSMSPVMFPYEGSFDASSGVLEMSGRGHMAHFGGDVDYRMTQHFRNDDTHDFHMYVTIPGGPEVKMFSYEYTRAS